jgi:hypothetical protein
MQPVFHVPSDAIYHRRDANDPDCELLLAARRPLHFSDIHPTKTNKTFPPPHMRDFRSPTLSIPVQIKRHFYFYLISLRATETVCLCARGLDDTGPATRLRFIFIFDNVQFIIARYYSLHFYCQFNKIESVLENRFQPCVQSCRVRTTH